MAYEEEFWREHFLASDASLVERADFMRNVGAIAWAHATTYFKEHPNEHNLPMMDGVPVVSQADMRAFGRQLDMTTAAGRCWQALAKYESRCSAAGVGVDSQLQVRFFDAQHAARAGLAKAVHLDLMSAARLARLFAQSRYDYYTPWAPLSRFPSMSLGAAGFPRVLR